MLHKLLLKFGYLLVNTKSQSSFNALEYNTENKADEFYKNHKIQTEEHIINLLKFIDQKGICFNNKSVGDFGCGTGLLLGKLAEKYKNCLFKGFDFSEKALETARKNTNVLFEKYDITQPVNQKFDIIFCIQTLEHIAGAEKVISTIKNSLNNNGIILITVPNGRLDFFGGHIHFWSKESFTLFLQKMFSGYELEIDYFDIFKLYAIIKPIN